MSNTIEIGKTYQVNSTRKGQFTGIVTNIDETWADVLITDGRARAMLDINEREQGETVTVRRSLCTFTQLEEA
jgi:hypothetical protein